MMNRFCLCWFAPACLGLLACAPTVQGDVADGGGGATPTSNAGGTGAGGAGGCAPSQAGGQPNCAPATEISSTQGVASVLPATWADYGGYTSGPLPVTPDLLAAANIVIDAADIAVPTNCGSHCEQSVSFYSNADLAGVEWAWNTLTIDAGARFRLRAVILDTGIGPPVPQLWVLPPCDQSCEPDEQRCAADAVCYDPNRYCRTCEGASAEACGCFTFCGAEPDGTYCEYHIGGDILTTGTCTSGVCHSEWE